MCGAAEKPDTKPEHLFILSGQSNMTAQLEQGFTEKVAAAFGKDNVVIVRSMKSGRCIRFWVEDYGMPGSSVPPAASKNKENGSQYTILLDAVKKAGDARAFKTVTFVWMQGESDAISGRSAAYEPSFRKLHKRLLEDLGLKSMFVVIGRISDFGLHGEKAAGWREVRAVQEKLAGDLAGAWIDTDDLNNVEGKPEGDLHYPSDQRVTLGQRLGDKAVGLISSKP
jgi:Carbohydrate esterase, sialic acid-specific acetylesterase